MAILFFKNAVHKYTSIVQIIYIAKQKNSDVNNFKVFPLFLNLRAK